MPLAGLILVGASAVTLTQISFQVGELAANFPANEALAPVVAVVLGAVILHERVPVTPLTVTAYVCCLTCITGGLIRLASSFSEAQTTGTVTGD